ncbi:MAG: class I SAM-dependent methyltransferase [Pyrinomonadaceae bacterium]
MDTYEHKKVAQDEWLNEIASNRRFEFGKNWAKFLLHLDEERINRAVMSLQSMLGVESLIGKTFLDIGSGSGLFSLAARKLGASVLSVDYDPQCVACTQKLKDTYFPEENDWKILYGSILDQNLVQSFGQFDIVYSWGVLHHTGDLWAAIKNASDCVRPGGLFYIAIYNDMGRQSLYWKRIKKIYCSIPQFLRKPFAVAVIFPSEFKMFLRFTFSLRPGEYLNQWRGYSKLRGMSKWHDIIDWVGGYPYEFASPDEIFRFCRDRGFILTELKSKNAGLGCNEFVFRLPRE